MSRAYKALFTTESLAKYNPVQYRESVRLCKDLLDDPEVRFLATLFESHPHFNFMLAFHRTCSTNRHVCYLQHRLRNPRPTL